MILDKKLNVKIAKYNIEHYINFFDVKLGDIIEIDTELHLQSESNKKINVKCDLCEEQRYIKYQSYRKNKERNIKYPIYTCDKCSHIKLKETNKEKYGVEYYSQHEDRNEKVKNTFNKDTGISDSIGSEKFILSVIAKKPGSGGGLYEETARINVKLK